MPSINVDSALARVRRLISEGHIKAALQSADKLLSSPERHAEQFEVRKMLLAHRLGVPAEAFSGAAAQLEQLDLRIAWESGLLDICHDIGTSLLNSGRLAEAWHYLQVVSERPDVQRLLADFRISEANGEILLDILLGHGVEVPRGIELTADQYGVCRAISVYDALAEQWPTHTRQAAAAIVAERFYYELHNTIATHLSNSSQATEATGSQIDSHPSNDNTLQESRLTFRHWLSSHPELFRSPVPCFDVTHLAAVVRIGRLCTERQSVSKLRELCEVGLALDPRLHPPDEAPFAPFFSRHAEWYEAILTRRPQAVLRHLEEQAQTASQADHLQLLWEIRGSILFLLEAIGDASAALSQLLSWADTPALDDVPYPIAPTILRLGGAVGRLSEVETFFLSRDAIAWYLKAATMRQATESANQNSSAI